MTIQEFNRRWFLIDETILLEMSDNKRLQTLDEKRARLVLRVLGIVKEPVPVPNRSFELSIGSEIESAEKPVTGIALQLLSLLAEYKDPISAAQIAQLGAFNKGTMSSRLSVLKAHGLLSAGGKPYQYMLTGKGHAALIQNAPQATAEGADAA